jgi:hypothetical protein
MLYQLSYASTAKPTETITAAIKLQAAYHLAAKRLPLLALL